MLRTMAKQVRIYDLDVKYEIVHRNIKYPRLELKTGELVLVLPKDCRDYEGIIEKHKDWIFEKISLINNSFEDAKEKALDFKRTNEEFRDLVHSHVEHISNELKLNVNEIYFRKMITKWGSCSARKNLTINTFLKYLPDNLVEYVIFHEMIHLIERRHNEHFWNKVSQKFSDHQKMEKDLLVYWFLIQKVIGGS